MGRGITANNNEVPLSVSYVGHPGPLPICTRGQDRRRKEGKIYFLLTYKKLY